MTPYHAFLKDVGNYQMHEVKMALRHNENKKEYINVSIMISFTCKHTKS
jgi:hypothetical protein